MTTTATKRTARTVRAIPKDGPESDLQHYSRTATAEFLDISPRYLLDLVAAGEIGCTLIGRAYKFTGRHIREFSAKNEIAAGPRGRKAA